MEKIIFEVKTDLAINKFLQVYRAHKSHDGLVEKLVEAIVKLPIDNKTSLVIPKTSFPNPDRPKSLIIACKRMLKTQNPEMKVHVKIVRDYQLGFVEARIFRLG